MCRGLLRSAVRVFNVMGRDDAGEWVKAYSLHGVARHFGPSDAAALCRVDSNLRTHIYAKLGINDKALLVRWAIREGLIVP